MPVPDVASLVRRDLLCNVILRTPVNERVAITRHHLKPTNLSRITKIRHHVRRTMSELEALVEQAARAERLARSVTNQEVVERLRELAREYQNKAAALRARLHH